jgi:hypothetical protein
MKRDGCMSIVTVVNVEWRDYVIAKEEKGERKGRVKSHEKPRRTASYYATCHVFTLNSLSILLCYIKLYLILHVQALPRV